MELNYIQRIAANLGFSSKQISNIFQLQSQGATIPFMARYRKEATGNLNEVQISEAVEMIKYFSDLDKRKETVRRTLEGLLKLTAELDDRIQNCYDATELEDIYLPFKPKRKTRALAAKEKGLEPLARLIFAQEGGKYEEQAIGFINEQVKDADEALQGARDIMAEWIAENENGRNRIRQLFREGAIISSKVLPGKKDEQEAQNYRDYFAFSEPLSEIPSHRILAIRRGEKEGWLVMNLSIDKLHAVECLERIFLKDTAIDNTEVRKAIEDSFDRLMNPSIESEFRTISRNKADEQAIKVFAENLRQLLLASPLGSRRILAIDPGFRTGCKAVCLDEQGIFLHPTTIYPHPPQKETQQSLAEIMYLTDRYQIQAIGIGNGTAGRETEQFIRSIEFGKPMSIFMVNENGASIYSASEVAREEFPDQDVTIRGAISIGRRLLDPLSELVKIDPKSIGVGQYQHDVHQTRLKEELDRVVESCVNHVGVDVNTASRHLLTYVSGLSGTLAKNIVDYRLKNGAFKTRHDLKKVGLMGPKAFEQCAGFLRIREARNPLDNSAVHPEAYWVVETMAKDINCSVAELIQNPGLRKKISKTEYVSDAVGEFTIDDILKELEKPGRDPRQPIEEFRFEQSIRSIEDIRTGMTVPGIITNITNFGAFVDIGIKQDGLVHISQMSNSFISDPNEVVKLQQKIMVRVIDIDIARKRISLSMKDITKESKKDPQKAMGEEPQVKTGKTAGVKNPGPEDSLEEKLKELKLKFKN
ncbi:MAG TPA: Tex family protein [Puia sp.]|nr:Tex family protein [Puia sp.]